MKVIIFRTWTLVQVYLRIPVDDETEKLQTITTNLSNLKVKRIFFGIENVCYLKKVKSRLY